MSPLNDKLSDRAKRKSAKREEKRYAIAMSSIQALRKLGYANTSLRDIAADAGLSLGTFHYYFEDKSELISYCVQIYIENLVRQLLQSGLDATTQEEIVENVAGVLARTLVKDSQTLRIWYDIRLQSMFEERFRPTKDDCEREFMGAIQELVRFLEIKTHPHMVYAQIDGLFYFFMQRICEGHDYTEDFVKDAYTDLISKL